MDNTRAKPAATGAAGGAFTPPNLAKIETVLRELGLLASRSIHVAG